MSACRQTKPCEACGTMFLRGRRTQPSWERARFCSTHCANRTIARRTPAAERFEDKYVPEPNSGCWLWTGYISNNGYGRFGAAEDGRISAAHRFSYQHFCEEIPAGLVVLHSCDTPSCVNPDHLSVGTQPQNLQQMRDRGRHSRGASHPGAKLTDDLVREIRASGETGRALARRLGVSEGVISQVKSRQKWGHVQ